MCVHCHAREGTVNSTECVGCLCARQRASAFVICKVGIMGNTRYALRTRQGVKRPRPVERLDIAVQAEVERRARNKAKNFDNGQGVRGWRRLVNPR